MQNCKLNMFNTLNKMCAYYCKFHKEINISHKPWVTMYTFCIEFRILISNTFLNFLIFENWKK